MDTVTIKLPEFEGPIELLWALVQKNEVNVCNLDLKNLVEQMVSALGCTEDHLDMGAESIAHASNLLWIKSRTLLPKAEVEAMIAEDPSNLQMAMLQKLVEYCRFKDAASHLSLREEKAKESFLRPYTAIEGIKKPLGIEHVSLSELAAVFQGVLDKAKGTLGTIEEEEWRVSDKMKQVRAALENQGSIPFDILFSAECSKLELIVLFLAVLELMKLNEIRVQKKTNQMVVVPYG